MVKQDTHDNIEVTSRRRGRVDNGELSGGSRASILLARAILSGRKSFISTYWRDCTFCTSLAGTGAKEDARRNTPGLRAGGPAGGMQGDGAAVEHSPDDSGGWKSPLGNVGIAAIAAGTGSPPRAIEREQGRQCVTVAD